MLRNVTWGEPGDRIGLVGVNGAGKSTQMRLIAGQEEPSSSQVVHKGERIAYLQQEFDVDLIARSANCSGPSGRRRC